MCIIKTAFSRATHIRRLLLLLLLLCWTFRSDSEYKDKLVSCNRRSDKEERRNCYLLKIFSWNQSTCISARLTQSIEDENKTKKKSETKFNQQNLKYKRNRLWYLMLRGLFLFKKNPHDPVDWWVNIFQVNMEISDKFVIRNCIRWKFELQNLD